MPVEEVVTHGVDGLVVEHDRPDQLVRRVSQLLDHQDLRESLGRAARQRAADFDAQVTLPRLTRLIEA